MKPAPIWNATLWLLLAATAFLCGSGAFSNIGTAFVPLIFTIYLFILAGFNIPTGWSRMRWIRNILALMVVAVGYYLGYCTLWSTVWRHQRRHVLKALNDGTDSRPFQPNSRPIVSLAATQLLAERADNGEVSSPSLASRYQTIARDARRQILSCIQENYSLINDDVRWPGPMTHLLTTPRPEDAKEHAALIDSVTQELSDNPAIADSLFSDLVSSVWNGVLDGNPIVSDYKDTNAIQFMKPWTDRLFLFVVMPLIYGYPIRRYPPAAPKPEPSAGDAAGS